MLSTLKPLLNLQDPFKICLWAVAACAFWGCMQFGEVTIHSRAAFSGSLHLKRMNMVFGNNLDNKLYARLDLPSAKTAKPGEIQQVFLTPQGSVCPIEALNNLFNVVPATGNDPLFSWTDKQGMVRPIVRATALAEVNSRFRAVGWGNAFGHSFHIGVRPSTCCRELILKLCA